jgi:SulP family sulfate permease
VGTLLMPVHYAVFLGVFMHILLYVFRSAEAVRVEQIVILEDGRFAETAPPEQLSAGEITILQPVGSLFFAGAARFEDQLPAVGQARRAVVILRLRDRDEVGSTFIRALERYAIALQAQDNKLMLEGLGEQVLDQLERTDLLHVIGEENVYLGQPLFGAALREAVAAAAAWIAQGSESVQ